MSGDQLLLVIAAAVLVLPAMVIHAVRAILDYFALGGLKELGHAYVATLAAMVLLVTVVHYLPKVPAIWQSLAPAVQ